MKVKNRLAAAALMLAATGSLYAQDPSPAGSSPGGPEHPIQPAAQDSSEEIRLLRARLDQLEAQQRAAAQKAEVTKTATQVAEDALKRSQMFDIGSFSAGYKDHRFYLGSDDGNFVFRPWIHMQFREVTTDRQDFKNGGTADQHDSGFEMRRLRFGFDGNAFTPDLTYFFNWASVRANGTSNVTDSTGKKIGTVSNSLGGAPLLEEAWVKYRFTDTPFFIKGGQIKDPFMHDQIVSSRYQQSTERSMTADIFANGDAFTEGVTFIYDPKSWVRTEAGVTHGIRSANTNFLDYPNTNAYNYGAAGRAEFKLMGRWQDYSQIGAVDVKEPLLVIGVGADYAERGHSNQTMGVVDAQYADPSGLSLYGAAVDRYTNHNFGIYTQSATGASISAPPASVANTPTNEYAGLIQAGFIIDKHWEPFGRYEYIHIAGTAAGSKNYFQAITGGANYYFAGHRAKFTLQLTYLPNGIPIDDTPNDILASPSGKGEFSGVVQFQLLL